MMLAGSSLAADFSEPVPAPGQPEGIVFNPASGNYIITYEAEDELRPRGMYQTIYVPPNKINPVLRSKFKLTPNGDVAYRYMLKNGKDSQQNLISLGILVTSAKGATISTIAPKYRETQTPAETALALSQDARKVVVDTPPGWDGGASPNFHGTGLNVGWSYWDEKVTGLPPGKSQGGFGYESADLPGIGLAGMRGRTPILAFAGYGPSQEISEQLNEIRKKTSGVTRPAAVPMFFVATPFNAAALLERLQHHAKVDLVKFQLIDPAFAASFDPWFTAAIDAAKRGNPEGVRYQIKELRRLLKQEHHDADKEDESDETEDEQKNKPKARIDKLAARVLDFDLKYIDKRLKGE
jgi:hypothetical protein